MKTMGDISRNVIFQNTFKSKPVTFWKSLKNAFKKVYFKRCLNPMDWGFMKDFKHGCRRRDAVLRKIFFKQVTFQSRFTRDAALNDSF